MPPIISNLGNGKVLRDVLKSINYLLGTKEM